MSELKRRNAIGKQTRVSIMPTYRFHVAPEDSTTDVLLCCTHDDEALNEAKWTMRDVLLDSAPEFALGSDGALALAQCVGDCSMIH